MESGSKTWPHICMLIGVVLIISVAIDSFDGVGASWTPLALYGGIALYVTGRFFVFYLKKKK